MQRYFGWLADLASRLGATHPFRKRSKVEKALIRRLTRDAEQRKRDAEDAPTARLKRRSGDTDRTD